jgi:hypothetical protein
MATIDSDAKFGTIGGRRREILGVPIVGVAIAILGWHVSNDPTLPEFLPRLLYVTSVLVFLGGMFLWRQAPAGATLTGGEEVVEAYHPSVVVSYILMVIALVPIALAVYVYQATEYPYIYVLIPLFIGLYLLFRGVARYWKNTLTTYAITTERVVQETRFFSRFNKNIELEDIKTKNQLNSVFGRLVGLESVVFKRPEETIRFVDVPADREILSKVRQYTKIHSTQRRHEDLEHLAERILREKSDTPAQESTEESEPEETIDRAQEKRKGETEESQTSESSRRNLQDEIDQLDRFTSAWYTDGCENATLRELVEQQVATVEEYGITVIFPEIGAEADPYKHEMIPHPSSSEPKGTIIAVLQLGLRGDGVEARDAKVVTSRGE